MDLILNAIKSVAYIFIDPLFIIFLIAMSFVFYVKNKKLAFMQRMIIGENINSPLELTLSQITLGIIAGFLASILISILGITFKEGSGIELIFSLTILSIFFRGRAIKLPYLAFIFGALSIVFTYFKIGGSDINLFRINITSLIALIGVIYILKGFLIIFDGSKGSMAVFSKKEEKIIGGYVLSRNWMLPVAIFIALKLSGDSATTSDVINTPSWWPLLNSSSILELIKVSVLVMVPFFTLINYSATTFTKTKKEKSRLSGIYTILYGIIIILISILTKFGLAMEVLAIVLTPIIYEFIFRFERKMEEKREPIFFSDDAGICVLDVIPFSRGYNVGIKAGDKIIRLNGNKVLNEKEIYASITNNYMSVELELIDLCGNNKKVMFEKGKMPGILLVPKSIDENKKINLTKEKILEMVKKLKNK